MSEHDFERVTHFPVKLWDVVNDDITDIFRWSEDGESFFVDDVKYELEIMEKYPGFVQISSFANLRRLLREYSFTWQNNETGEFQFSHPGFKRGQRDLIFTIRTKRKAIQAASGQPLKLRRRASNDPRNPKCSSKAWMQPSATGKVNLRVDTLMRFPEKFWAVVNDPNDLLYWGEDGDTIIVDDKKYEDEIMTKYPGFVQINSFANLRRLLREYGFSWSIRENGFFEFSHSHMKKDNPELLKGVKTKRKAMKAGAHHPYLPYFKVENSYYPASKACLAERFENIERSCRSSPEITQAVGSIHQHGLQSESRELIHPGSGDHHSMSGNLYSYPPYRLIPSYQHLNATQASLHQAGVWPFHGTTEKIESPFYYSAWNGNHTCNTQSFGDSNEQLSPSIAQGSSSGVQASSTGSCESVYASSSKGSPSEVIDEHAPEQSPESNSGAVTFQSMELPPPGSHRIYEAHDTFDNASSQGQPYCETGLYSPIYRPKYHTVVNDGAVEVCHNMAEMSKVNQASHRDQGVKSDVKLIPLKTSIEMECDRRKICVSEPSSLLAGLLEDSKPDQDCGQDKNQPNLAGFNAVPFDLTKTTLPLRLKAAYTSH